MTNSAKHFPVLLTEVLAYAQIKEGAAVLDATLGLGGHAREFLQQIGTSGSLIACEADASNLRIAQKNLAQFPNKDLKHANFRDLLPKIPAQSLDLVFFDLGVASSQLDVPERGFSFRLTGPLDLRFDQRQILTAAGFLNGATEFEIARVLREFGEIGIARKIARNIINFRKKQKLKTTFDLAHLVQPKSLRAQVFQALRIFLNAELESLTLALPAALKALRQGGRLGIISFHSLEDRLVKNFLRQQPALKILTKKPIQPSKIEVQSNPRARSARLRFAEKSELV